MSNRLYDNNYREDVHRQDDQHVDEGDYDDLPLPYELEFDDGMDEYYKQHLTQSPQEVDPPLERRRDYKR